MRVKSYPWTDVYHKGQRACCVYIRGFRTDMFTIENSAVGNDFNQITFFLSSSSPLQSVIALKKSLFCLTRFKTTAAEHRWVCVTSCLRVSVASPLPPLFIPEEGSKMLLNTSKLPCFSLRALRHAQIVIWNKICKSGLWCVSKREVTQQLLFVTVSKVIPFNSWQEIQRGEERRDGRGTAYGKWNDSSDQNKLFLVSLRPDPIIRLSVRSDNCWSRDSPDGRTRERKGESLRLK